MVLEAQHRRKRRKALLVRLSRRPWAAAIGNGEVWAVEQSPVEKMRRDWDWGLDSPAIYMERRRRNR